jgi:ankyrin repeat protein
VSGWTALHFASFHNRIEAIELLLKFGASINAADRSGETPLMTAVMPMTIWKLDAVNVLLERGARVNIRNNSGWTALHFASFHNKIEAIALLLKFEADINATDTSKETPLMNAVRNSRFDAVKLLLERGARLDMKCNDGLTALGIAFDCKRIVLIELLLDFTEIDATDEFEETILMKAVRWRNLYAVKVLLKRGARLDLKNKQEKTALGIAKDERNRNNAQNEKVIELLETQQKKVLLEQKKSAKEKTAGNTWFGKLCGKSNRKKKKNFRIVESETFM